MLEFSKHFILEFSYSFQSYLWNWSIWTYVELCNWWIFIMVKIKVTHLSIATCWSSMLCTAVLSVWPPISPAKQGGTVVATRRIKTFTIATLMVSPSITTVTFPIAHLGSYFIQTCIRHVTGFTFLLVDLVGQFSSQQPHVIRRRSNVWRWPEYLKSHSPAHAWVVREIRLFKLQDFILRPEVALEFFYCYIVSDCLLEKSILFAKAPVFNLKVPNSLHGG